MKTLVVLSICLLSFSLQAQRGTYKQKKSRSQHFSKRTIDPLYSYSRSPCRPMGIQFSLGATYTFTDLTPPEYSATSSGGDSTYKWQHDPSGRFGYYFDVGMAHILKRPNKIMQYWDWALGIKHFAGREDYKGEIRDNTGQISTQNGHGKWDNGYLFLRANLHNVIPIGKYNFIDNSLGINLDYQVYEFKHNRTYIGENTSVNEHFQQKFIAGIHYRLGFGIKLKEGYFLVPFAEIPVFTAYEWNMGKPVIRWFSSWYLPFTVGVKFSLLFKKDANACPPVYQNSSDEEKSNQFQQMK